jgi:hypothetical protein
MEIKATKAHTAAQLLRTLHINFDPTTGTAPASIIRRLYKLNLEDIARVLDGAPVTRLPQLEAELADVRKRLEQTDQQATKLRRKIQRAAADVVDSRSSGEGGGFRRAFYETTFPPIKCAVCRRNFRAGRRDAKTCSPKCRVALHRKALKSPE